jgi:ATP-dependent helicase HrpB
LVVIDTGLHKVARYDAGRGVDSLTTERVTLDSADQRAGRAARLGPGTVRRLWDGRDRLRPHREAEIHRVDLSGPLLSILAWGPSTSLRASAGTASFDWFDRPSQDRIDAALALLQRLGAIERDQITALGSQISSICVSAGEALDAEASGYGDLPLVTISSTDPGAYRLRQQEALARRSTHGRHVVATHSGHWVPLDEPELVIAVVTEMVQTIRASTPNALSSAAV